MKTNQTSTRHPDPGQYALHREGNCWHLSFEGEQAGFKHELGVLYVAYLLGEPPRQPVHGVALALHAREKLGQPAGPVETVQQRLMGLDDAAAVRALWRRQRELERVLADRLEIEPVKAEAQAELEEITEHLRKSPWMSRHGAERCARAVAAAIRRLHARLAAALDAEGKPHPVLQAFARHLYDHLLLPSRRGHIHARRLAWVSEGCFIYVPPQGVVWEVQSPESAVGGSALAEAQGSTFNVPGSKCNAPRPASRRPAILAIPLALGLLAAGCAGPQRLQGGKAVTTRKPAGVIEQTLTQGENPSQATKQDQESVKVRTYTLPAGSRIEQAPTCKPHSSNARLPSNNPSIHQSTNPAFLSAFVLSAPMPVAEREETRARTELGAAQKDTARELGAKLASLKGIVWVGVGLFVFGLVSLVWPPLKAVIGSVTTSAAMMLGGVALMVLPSLIVGNELLILGGVGLAVGGWFLAHRHGQLRGMVTATTTPPPTQQRPMGSDQ